MLFRSVISSRCGGPEQFVIRGRTGDLVDSSPEAMAQAIRSVCSDRAHRQRLSQGAKEWIAANASLDSARGLFRHHLRACWPDLMHGAEVAS